MSLPPGDYRIKISDEGTITLPMDLLSRLGVEPGDEILIRARSDRLTLHKALQDRTFHMFVPRLNLSMTWKQMREIAIEEAIEEDVRKGHYGPPQP